MIDVLITSALAVSVEEAKLYARIDGSDEDALVASLVRVAQMQVEDYTGRAAGVGTFRYVSSGWPSTGLDQFYRFPAFRGDASRRAVVLARSPLVSVESVKYVDEAGTLTTLSASLYSLDTSSLPGRLIFRNDANLPNLDANSGRHDLVQIEFTAGVANPLLVQAIKMCVNNWYENRVPVVTGTIATELPFSVKNLLRSQRIDTPFTS